VPRQLRLPLNQSAPLTRATFLVGPSNVQAAAIVDAWPRWPGGSLALIGPAGVGKSHLAVAWARAAGALVVDITDLDLAAIAAHQGPVLAEDADRGAPDEAMFHLMNLAARQDRGLLFTARTAPAAWPAALADLRSRLNATPVALIDEPDDEILQGVLENFFRERNIRPGPDLYPYLLQRINRSIPDAREIVRRLDEAGDDAAKPVSRVLARRILEDQNQILDLFGE
jgi:chromosomal replication initiation ATPase DnaA